MIVHQKALSVLQLDNLLALVTVGTTDESHWYCTQLSDVQHVSDHSPHYCFQSGQ